MKLIWGLIAVGLAALCLSFLGALRPVGDSLAVFRFGLCLCLLALAAALRARPLPALLVVGLACAGMASVLWYKLPQGAPGAITIYQKNLFHQNSDLMGVADDILATKPDFVTLQELSVANDALLDRLSTAYPHQHICRVTQRSGIAVLSQIKPVGDGTCSRRYGLAQITVDLPQGRHHVASVHLSWPFPGAQPRQIRHLIDDLEALAHPILLAGDFNMVPWSHALSDVAHASGTRHAGPARTTFLIGFVPISIDHVFAPGGGRSVTRPLLGSDHFGVLAKVHPQTAQSTDNSN